MREYVYPLNVPPHIFIGKKPAAVMFGDERVEVKTWRQVYTVIIGRCNQDPDCHDMLLYLRNRAAGKVRVFISDSSDGMRWPLKVDEGIFCEVNYGTETLLHILTVRILKPARFDYSNIKIALRGDV